MGVLVLLASAMMMVLCCSGGQTAYASTWGGLYGNAGFTAFSAMSPTMPAANWTRQFSPAAAATPAAARGYNSRDAAAVVSDKGGRGGSGWMPYAAGGVGLALDAQSHLLVTMTPSSTPTSDDPTVALGVFDAATGATLSTTPLSLAAQPMGVLVQGNMAICVAPAPAPGETAASGVVATSVSVVDIGTGAVVAASALQSVPTPAAQAVACALNDAGTLLFVASPVKRMVAAIQLATLTVAYTVPLPASCPDGSPLQLAQWSANSAKSGALFVLLTQCSHNALVVVDMQVRAGFPPLQRASPVAN